MSDGIEGSCPKDSAPEDLIGVVGEGPYGSWTQSKGVETGPAVSAGRSGSAAVSSSPRTDEGRWETRRG